MKTFLLLICSLALVCAASGSQEGNKSNSPAPKKKQAQSAQHAVAPGGGPKGSQQVDRARFYGGRFIFRQGKGITPSQKTKGSQEIATQGGQAAGDRAGKPITKGKPTGAGKPATAPTGVLAVDFPQGIPRGQGREGAAQAKAKPVGRSADGYLDGPMFRVHDDKNAAVGKPTGKPAAGNAAATKPAGKTTSKPADGKKKGEKVSRTPIPR